MSAKDAIMMLKPLGPSLFVSSQLAADHMAALADAGIGLIICNRPDAEERGQPTAAELAAVAQRHDIRFVHIPIVGDPSDAAILQMQQALDNAGTRTLAYCRTGNRSTRVGALAQAGQVAPSRLIKDATAAGFDINALAPRLSSRFIPTSPTPGAHFDVVVVGGGASGIAAAASLLRRRRSLRVAIADSAELHHYQPGWTMVGAGIFSRASTERRMADVIPDGATWLTAHVDKFDPEHNRLTLGDGRSIAYDVLVVATGLTLDWDAIPGLSATLGRNGVTSNYRADLAPYTALLANNLKRGRAIFTQPPMPIKCAGAPQKALYLSCDRWRRAGTLRDISASFHTATPALFGVAAYVPALMRYIERYNVNLNLGSRLVAVDGENRQATFERAAPDGTADRTTETFDMLHVCPPQVAPAVIADSALAGPNGFVEVDPATLRHSKYVNIFALGDIIATTNAKTAAAARKQAPVVAQNVLATLDHSPLPAAYDGYGSCPLTVERGKIVLAEFGYGGTLLPSFPRWLLDGTRPTRLAWFLKAVLLPKIYWHAMLKGREWLAAPRAAR